MGEPSLIDALKVDSLIEEKDIRDTNDKKALVIDEPGNHLHGFNDVLIWMGMQYVPTVLSQEGRAGAGMKKGAARYREAPVGIEKVRQGGKSDQASPPPQRPPPPMPPCMPRPLP